MLHLKQIMPKNKRITTIGIATAIGVAAIAIGVTAIMGHFPAIEGTVNNALSRLPDTSAVISEDAKNAIAYIQSQIERQLM